MALRYLRRAPARPTLIPTVIPTVFQPPEAAASPDFPGASRIFPIRRYSLQDFLQTYPQNTKPEQRLKTAISSQVIKGG